MIDTLCSCRCLPVPEDEEQYPAAEQAEWYQDAYYKKYWKADNKCQNPSQGTSQNPPKWVFLERVVETAYGGTSHVITLHHLKQCTPDICMQTWT